MKFRRAAVSVLMLALLLSLVPASFAEEPGLPAEDAPEAAGESPADVPVPAEEASGADIPGDVSGEAAGAAENAYTVTLPPEDGEPLFTNEELETRLAEEILYDRTPAGTYACHDTSSLTEEETGLYDDLLVFVRDLAQKGGSSSIELNSSDNEYLSGFGNDVHSEALSKMLSTVCFKLRREYPEYFYWADALLQYSAGIGSNGQCLFVTVSFLVDEQYRDGGDEYCVDASKMARAKRAKDNAADYARQIRESGKNDWDMIIAAAEKISDLTDYNSEATDKHYSGGCDPWTIVNVFAGEGENKVVCEGYAKSFQYLFDLIFPDGRQQCFCVTNENHMWNIVRFNGESYFTDVTYYDGNFDTIMIAPKNGKVKTVEPGKVYTVLDADETRTYDGHTLSCLGPGVLTLAEKDSEPGGEGGSADLNGDSRTDTEDAVVLMKKLTSGESDAGTDINRDGITDILDLIALMQIISL